MSNKSRAAELAAQFKAKQKKVKPLSPTAPVSLLIKGVENEDGSPLYFDCELRRVDVATMITGGQLPEYLAQKVMAQSANGQSQAQQLEAAQERLATMTPGEVGAMLSFQVRVAQFACVAPKLVFRTPESDDELDMREIEYSGNIISAIFNYSQGLSPDIPIATTDGGMTTLAAVETFPDGVQRGELPGPGDDGETPGAVNSALAEDRG